MKIREIAKSFSVLVLIIGITACSKSDDGTPNDDEPIVVNAIISLLLPSDLTESSFTANWDINTSEINSIFIEVSLTNSFSVLVQNIEVQNKTQSSFPIVGLHGATVYYHRLIVKLNDGSTKNSNIETVITGHVTENVSFTTSDGITIEGQIAYLSTNTSANPGIIFMHEMGAFTNKWAKSDVVRGLIAEGYVCLSIYFRGHGNSTQIDNIQVLFDDKSLIAKDLIAAMNFLKNRIEVDPQNLALVGASLGAIMAVAGNGFEEVKTSISVSGIRDGIFEIFPTQVIKSVLYIVGELDIKNITFGDFPAEAKYMYGITETPKKLIIVPDKQAHGTSLLSESLNIEIINWINMQFDK